MKLSIILPYWKRAEVAKQCLDLYAQHYLGKLDFEVILVDDGSDDFEYDAPWVTFVRLPKKSDTANPCVPINRGVEASKGEIIVLSGPDILHTESVLPQMLEELEAAGPFGYILASCWCEQSTEWHCHSSKRADLPQPLGSGFHFCAMFRRWLWDRAGGFDEAYRAGAYYDDPDWVNRAHRAGAIFKIRDDLVVQHIRRGCYSDWRGGAADVNREIYRQRWGV